MDANSNSVHLAVKPDTLADMANQMTEKVGLVHGLPYVADRQGFAATLEQVRPTRRQVEQARKRRASALRPNGRYLLTGIFRHVPPSLLHLCKCDGDQVCDGDVVSDEEGCSGPGGRIGCLRSVHR